MKIKAKFLPSQEMHVLIHLPTLEYKPSPAENNCVRSSQEILPKGWSSIFIFL